MTTVLNVSLGAPSHFLDLDPKHTNHNRFVKYTAYPLTNIVSLSPTGNEKLCVYAVIDIDT